MPLPQIDRNKTGGWVLIGGAVMCAWLFLSEVLAVYQSLQARGWPSVTGTVIESRPVIGCGKGSSYYPLVRYRYTFDSQQYDGRRIAFGNVGCGSEHSARQTAAEYTVGKSVSVWVNPSMPAGATLVVGNILEESWFGMAILPVFVLGGFLMGRSLLRQQSAA